MMWKISGLRSLRNILTTTISRSTLKGLGMRQSSTRRLTKKNPTTMTRCNQRRFIPGSISSTHRLGLWEDQECNFDYVTRIFNRETNELVSETVRCTNCGREKPPR